MSWIRLYQGLVGLLLLICASSVSAQDGTIAPIPEPVFISGRVVDDAGKPVWGLEVSAVTTAMGRTLYNAHTHGNGTGDGDFMATTDRDGRFAIVVPFSGIRYSVGFHLSASYQMVPVSVIASDDAQPLQLVAKQINPMDPIRVFVTLPGGQPATSQPVTLVSEYGAQWTGVTDDKGFVAFDDVRTQYLGQAMLMIEAEGLVAPLTIMNWRGPEPTTVALVRSATIRGRVVASDTDEPIADATVIINSGAASGLEWRVQTDADGRYSLSDLPPGSYRYRAVCATHSDRPPRGNYWHEREVELEPGIVTHASDFDMRPRATLRGRVVDPDGQPLEGAMVGYACHFGSRYDNTDAVFTDRDGKFELRPAYDNHTDLPLEAFHPLAGGARLRIQHIMTAELRNGIELVTTGTAAIRGRVTDQAGKPIAGVQCSYKGPLLVYDVTDEQGRYDLGRVQLVQMKNDQPPVLRTVGFSHKRPTPLFNALPVPDEPGPYYVPVGLKPEMTPDGEIELNAKLHATERLVFTGKLLDEQGNPRRDARIYLLRGQVAEQTKQQQALVAHFLQHRDAREVRKRQAFEKMQRGVFRGGDTFEPLLLPLEGAIQHLFVTATYEDGFWSFVCLRTDTSNQDSRDLMQLFGPNAATGHEAPPELEWITLMTVWGEGDDLAYELHKPTQIVEDQMHYAFPFEQ